MQPCKGHWTPLFLFYAVNCRIFNDVSRAGNYFYSGNCVSFSLYNFCVFFSSETVNATLIFHSMTSRSRVLATAITTKKCCNHKVNCKINILYLTSYPGNGTLVTLRSLWQFSQQPIDRFLIARYITFTLKCNVQS